MINQIDKTTNTVGIDMLDWQSNQNKVNVLFRYTMRSAPEETKLTGDIRLLDFVARSYAESCLTLIKRIKELEDADSLSMNEAKAYRYLPTMFCFQHYLEVRLKYLYMEITRTQVDTNYNLTDLLDAIKQNGFYLNIFDEPIKFIDQIEKNRIEHFRHLITEKFAGADQLVIPNYEFDKIKGYITNIEKQCKIYVEWLDSERLKASWNYFRSLNTITP